MEERTLETVPVRKINLADEVAKQLKELIVEGKLLPGDRLPSESAMAEMFSVGRTSVREALKALHAIGLIERTKQGTIVRNAIGEPYKELFLQLIIKKHSTEQLYEARMIFEIMIARLAASRATEEDLEEMRKHLSRMKSKKYDEYIQADADFHVAIAGAAQNVILYEAYQVIRKALTESLTDLISYFPQIVKTSSKQHQAIYDAIEAQDEDKAEELIKEHLAFLIEQYRKQVLGNLK
ncbi:MAG: FadR/GntR family transcriptional regulator [Bacillota bacterium]|nr:FadR/GntR family transcriptional regulator [Bacillota bacterium]